MKSLARLLISHVFISIFITFFLLLRLLNASLCFILVSFPQLLTNPMDWRYLVFLIICIIFSLVYFYTLCQLFKEVNQKSVI